MNYSTSHNKIYIYLGCFLAVALILVYAFIDPTSTPLFPKCPFRLLTGFQCPGCGSQRALHSILTLHFEDAFRYNAVLVMFIPFIILLIYASMTKKKHHNLFLALNSRTSIIISFTIIGLWWVLRNVFGWYVA